MRLAAARLRSQRPSVHVPATNKAATMTQPHPGRRSAMADRRKRYTAEDVRRIEEGDEIRHAVFDGLSFHGVSLKECLFEACSFEKADLRNVRLSSATFRECNLANALVGASHVARPAAMPETVSISPMS